MVMVGPNELWILMKEWMLYHGTNTATKTNVKRQTENRKHHAEQEEAVPEGQF